MARRLYDEEILYVDRLLGEILEQLEASGRPHAVLLTGDHGEHFGEHALMLHSNSLFEPLLRVPFVLAGDGVPRRHLESPPHLEDVVPSLLHLALGAEVEGLAGRSLLGPPVPLRSHVERLRDLLTIRDTEGWKLHLRLREDGSATPTALFHLPSDPGEERDLLAAEASRAERLLEGARQQLRRLGSKTTGPISEEHRAVLAELGYLENEDEE